MGLIDLLISLDRSLFSFLNGINSPFWDSVMTILSSKYTFIPLYGYFIFLAATKSKKKWLVLALMIGTVTVTDICASQLAKPYFQRLRPCHDSTLVEEVHTVNNKCGKQYGYFSSHASNTFGIACIVSLLFYRKNKKIVGLLMLWATLVAYSRVYLGVHFPLDVITGAICGIVVANLSYRFLIKIKAI